MKFWLYASQQRFGVLKDPRNLSFLPEKEDDNRVALSSLGFPFPDMTYNVSSVTLNPTQSINRYNNVQIALQFNQSQFAIPCCQATTLLIFTRRFHSDYIPVLSGIYLRWSVKRCPLSLRVWAARPANVFEF